MARLPAVITLVCTLFVAGILVKAGLPVAPALAIALLLVGVATFVVGRRMDSVRVWAAGIALWCFAAFASAKAAADALPDYNGTIIGLVTLLIEAAVVAAPFILYYASRSRRRLREHLAGRASLAARHGWLFKERQAFPPMLLPGQPTGKASPLVGQWGPWRIVEGRGVIEGELHGMRFRAFDFAKEPVFGLPSRTAGTAWQVFLPVDLPYIASAYGLPANVPTAGTAVHTTDEACAEVLFNPAVRAILADERARSQRWWVQGHFLWSVTPGSAVVDVERRADSLITLARMFSWDALRSAVTTMPVGGAG